MAISGEEQEYGLRLPRQLRWLAMTDAEAVPPKGEGLSPAPGKLIEMLY